MSDRANIQRDYDLAWAYGFAAKVLDFQIESTDYPEGKLAMLRLVANELRLASAKLTLQLPPKR